MTLLKMDDNITIKDLQRFFKIETGLNISFFYDGKEIDKKQTFCEFRRKIDHYLTMMMLRRPFDFHWPSPGRVFPLEYCMEVQEIAIVFKYYYEVDIRIFDANGKEAKANKRLKDLIPDEIMNRTIDIDRVNEINNRLIQIEKDIYNQWMEIDPPLDKKIQCKDNWLNDYELEVKLSYHLREDDPLFTEDSDNIIYIQKQHIFKGDWEKNPVADGENHSEDPKRKIFHCYLFHDLYDHCGVRYDIIQRIGLIWVDFNVTRQHFYED